MLLNPEKFKKIMKPSIFTAAIAKHDSDKQNNNKTK